MTRLLLVAAVLVIWISAAGVGAGAELDVYPGDSIQDAIDSAGVGDTIYVHEGEYCENVDVWKRVTLVGDGADVVTVWAADTRDHVFYVDTHWVNISGFTVTGAANWHVAGICLGGGAYRCNIFDNNALNNRYGIYLSYSSGNTLTNNTVNSNNFIGIYLSYSGGNTLTNNTVNSNNGYGIYMEHHSSGNTLTNNTVDSNNGYTICMERSSDNTLMGNVMVNGGIAIYGEQLQHWNTHTIHTNNTINGKTVYYWKNRIIGTVPQGVGQVILANCSNIVIQNQTLNNGSTGIELGFSSNNTLTDNNCSNNNLCGIHIYSSNNNTLQSNTVNLNCNGIELGFSSNNTLTDNTASDNQLGIYLLGYSSNNTLYHNNLINNTYHNAYAYYPYDIGTNQWDSGSEGNYWSDYTGTDSDGDGIGEDPHPIPGGGGRNVDNYPLMHPWSDTPQQKGDLNGDDQITPADAAIALRLAVTGAHNDAADVSGDHRVTSLDALMILQAAAGAIEL